MSKKLIALLLALVMVVALAACGQQAAPAAAPAAEPAASGSGEPDPGVRGECIGRAVILAFRTLDGVFT